MFRIHEARFDFEQIKRLTLSQIRFLLALMNNITIRKLIAATKRPKALINALLQALFRRRYIDNPLSPIRIQIEPTSRCNLECLSCSRSTYSEDMIGDMDFDNFKTIIDAIPNLLFVKIQGMGEPFFNKEIIRMLQYCKQKRIVTEIITNGTIFNEKCLPYLDRLIFSFDGGTKETFENLRPGANFEKVLINIRRAVEKNEKTIIYLSTVVSTNNIDELLKIVDLAKDIKVHGVHFGLVEQWIVEESKKRNQISDLYTLKLHRIKEALKYAKKSGLSTSCDISRNRAKTCLWPWVGLFVTYDGFVTPCCIRPDKRVMNFGNILKVPFNEIWNSEEYRKFRISLKSQAPTKICKNCPQ